MGLLKKTNTEKTYIKYEGGKIIEIKSESKKPSKSSVDDMCFNSDIPEASFQTYDYLAISNSDDDNAPHAKPRPLQLIKKVMLSKFVRGTICLAIIAFMAYSIVDAYQKIILDDAPPSTAEVTASALPIPSTDTEPIPSAAVSAPVSPANHQSLKNAFDIVATTNSIITDETSSEIESIRDCIDGTTTANELNTLISNYLSQKEAAYDYLTSSKTIFDSADMSILYSATESRLVNSISFSKLITKMLKSGTTGDSLESTISDFSADEKLCTKTQTNALISVLISQNIQYAYDESTNAVSYDLP